MIQEERKHSTSVDNVSPQLTPPAIGLSCSSCVWDPPNASQLDRTMPHRWITACFALAMNMVESWKSRRGAVTRATEAPLVNCSEWWPE